MIITNDDTNYSRDSGATRVNESGLIVGVDFSTTSTVFGLGLKTFTLSADAGVNRDWLVGSRVRATSQATPLGLMNGVVSSYNPTTQQLIIDVAESTGTGTSTDWRIGSLEFRRDFDPLTLALKGGLVEGGATCLTVNNLNGASYSAGIGVITPTTDKAPDGSSLFYTFTDNSTSQYGAVNKNAGSLPAGRYTLQAFVKKQDTVFGLQASAPINPSAVYFNALTGERLTTYNPNPNVIDRVIDFGDCFFYQTVMDLPAATYGAFLFPDPLNAGRTGISPANTESITYFGLSLLSGDAISFIPTTTVSVTRAADLLAVDGANFTQAYNQSQGTLLVECIPTDSVNSSAIASINDGTLDNEIRIGQKQTGTHSSIRAIASDGVTDVMGLVGSAASNILKSNGVDYNTKGAGITNGQINAVASSGVENYLSVGTSEAISTTDDSAESFFPISMSTINNGAHFGIGRFVIAPSVLLGGDGFSQGGVIVSTDGLAFRRINIAGLTQSLNEVTSNGTNQYVAVGGGGVIYTSPDAEVWTAQVSGTTGAFAGVHYFGGRYVAVGTTTGDSRYSDDGVSWTALSGSGARANDVYHNGTDLWVAVGNNGLIFSSSDGITWAAQTSGVGASLFGIHFADGLWVAVGNAGTVVTSPDGITWTDRTATSGNVSNITEVNFFNNKFYYVNLATQVGENTAAGIVAGTTWTLRTAGVVAQLFGIATNGSRLLICGSTGAIATSEDGITFTSRTGNNATLNGAAFGSGTYVVVGNAVNGSGLIATVDPVTFVYQRRVSGFNSSPSNVRFVNGVFIATLPVYQVARSVDGVTWSVIPLTGSTATINDVAGDGNILITVGGSGRTSVSTDNGLTWSAAGAPLSGVPNLLSIASGQGIFVTVGSNGVIFTTPDGFNWTTRVSGTTNTLYAVHYSTRDQQWYAAGDDGTILRSADAITWESIANDALLGVIKDGELQANPVAGKWFPEKRNRVAMSWKDGLVSLSINGGQVFSDPSVVMPVVDRLNIGRDASDSRFLNGEISLVKSYKIAVTNNELRALSSSINSLN